MIRVLGVIWKSLFLLYFVLTLILFYPIFAVLLAKPSGYRTAYRLMRIWGHIIIYPVGIRYRVDYRFMPKADETYVYVSNHTSYLDIILTYCTLPHFFVFLGKKELKKLPLFRLFFRDMNILVDRESAVGSHRSFIEASKRLEQGDSIMIFPEGTIPRSTPKLKSLKNGAFRLAIEKQVDIVPITFLNNWKLLQDRPYLQGFMRPGLALIVVHPPVSVKGYTMENIDELKSKVKEIIEEPLQIYFRQ
jgi:1-acyl-sn-glycerol-3-phosphate acyltransferase